MLRLLRLPHDMAGARVVDVDEPRRLVECAQIERQRRFQQLVRHYLSQILYGCKSAYCHTPSCLSSSRRNPLRPVRPPTPLTARILAHYLASQDSPQQGLCPHELKVPPQAVEIESAVAASTQHAGNGADSAFLVYPPIWGLAQRPRGVDNGRCALLDAHMIDAVRRRRQTKKDVKSLAQNLYDSATVIYNCSRQIPSPVSVLALLRAAADPPQHPPVIHVEKPHTHPRSIARQHAQQNLRAHTHPSHMHTASEFLSNGSQLHRIPYQPPSSSAQARLPKTADTISPDSTANSPRLSWKQATKKKFTAGEERRTTISQNKSSVAASDHAKTISQHSTRRKPPLPVIPTLNCHILDELKADVDHCRNPSSHGSSVVDYDASYRSRPTKPFVNRSLFYTLSDPDALLRSFHDSNEAFKDSPLPHLDSSHLTHSFKEWHSRNGALVFDSLWIAMEALFMPPPELNIQKSPRLRPSSKFISKESVSEDGANHYTAPASFSRYLSNHEAAHLVLICIHALTSLVSVGWTQTWAQLRKLRSRGIIIPNTAPNPDMFSHPYLNLVDELEYEPAIRLADRLLCAIGARTCFEHILASLGRNKREQEEYTCASGDATLVDIVLQHLQVVERVALSREQEAKPSHDSNDDPGWTVTATFMEWLRTIIIKKWDSKAEINKWSNVGTAVTLLDKLRK